MNLTLTGAVWLIGIHSILHGIFGIIWIHTTNYVNYRPALINAFTVVNVILILLGFATFFILVFRRPMYVRVLGALFMLFTIAYLIVGLIYFTTYFPFYANSIFDSFFHYDDLECWVGPDYKVTFWHFITFLIILLIPLWFFYGFILCKFALCVCCLPCPPLSCAKYNSECAPRPRDCCGKEKLFYKIFKPKSCDPPPGCCPPPPPVCPVRKPNPCSKPTCPPPCPPPPCSPCTKKNPKFVLTLRSGKVLCK